MSRIVARSPHLSSTIPLSRYRRMGRTRTDGGMAMNSESSGRPKRRVHRLLVLMRRRQPSHARPTDALVSKGELGNCRRRATNGFGSLQTVRKIIPNLSTPHAYEVCEKVTFHPRPHMLWTMPSTQKETQFVPSIGPSPS